MDDKANSASAILRGLIRGLAQNQRRLIGVIRDKYKAPEDLNGAQLRELWGLLRAMLANCIGSKVVYLVIDAIDECRDDRPVLQLLEYIKKEPFKLPQIKVKWLITSRPSSEFERITGTDPGRCIIDLAMEEKASQSVEVFIEQSVNGMAKWNQKTKNDVLSFLRKVAEHTFLYVSMVWKELYQVPEWEISARLSELQSNNPGSILHGMYRVMLDRTLAMDKRSGNTYRQDILRVVLLATRVLNWAELAIAAGLPRQSYPYDHSSVGIGPIAELIQQCGHFLLLQSGKVYFFHKSASDYLLAVDAELSFLSLSHLLDHARIAHQCLVEECSTLHPRSFPDMDSIINRKPSKSDVQRLWDISYVHCHWVTHVIKAGDRFTDYHLVGAFLCDSLLPWLEAMAYLKELPRSIQMIQELLNASSKVWAWGGLADGDKGAKASLEDLMQDAFRFAVRYQTLIDEDPTQVYFLAMLFAPKGAPTRLNCRQRVSSCLQVVPEISEDWGPYLYSINTRWRNPSTLHGPSPMFTPGFSQDGKFIFRASEWRIARWNITDGSSAGYITWHERVILISRNGSILASEDATRESINIWEVGTKRSLSVIKRRGLLTMTPDGKTMTIQITELHEFQPFPSLRSKKAAKIYQCQGLTPLHPGEILQTSFLEIYETETGNLVQQVKCSDEDYISSLDFSSGGRFLAINRRGFNGALLWDTKACSMHYLTFSQKETLASAIFSPSGDILVTLSRFTNDGMDLDALTFWSSKSMSIMVRLVGHPGLACAISPDGRTAAVASTYSLSLWDLQV